jgi:hypothetical protein
MQYRGNIKQQTKTKLNNKSKTQSNKQTNTTFSLYGINPFLNQEKKTNKQTNKYKLALCFRVMII